MTPAAPASLGEPALSSGGPRRNSEGSPNFMTCSGSPRFRRRSSRPTRSRSRKLLLAGAASGFSLSRSEGEESLEDEDEDEESAANANATGNGPGYFDFEDVEDLDEIVDFRPHGESPRNSCGSGQANRLQVSVAPFCLVLSFSGNGF